MTLRALLSKLAAPKGAAAIEFAVVAPMLAAGVIATIEIGFAIQAQLQAQEAASAGAQYASIKGFNAAGINSAVLNATSGAGVTASPAPFVFFGCPTGGSVAVVAQGTVCGDGLTARSYVKISATAPRTSIVPMPILGLPANLTAHTTVRLP